MGAITYRCFGHADVAELAANSSVPVLNALSDKHHPCQAAADLMTIMEHFSERKNLKVSWVGDGNNVLHDLMLACAMLGIDFHYAYPKGYEPEKMLLLVPRTLQMRMVQRWLELTTLLKPLRMQM